MDRREANLRDRAEVMLTLSFIVCHRKTRKCGGINQMLTANTPSPKPSSGEPVVPPLWLLPHVLRSSLMQRWGDSRREEEIIGAPNGWNRGMPLEHLFRGTKGCEDFQVWLQGGFQFWLFFPPLNPCRLLGHSAHPTSQKQVPTGIL